MAHKRILYALAHIAPHSSDGHAHSIIDIAIEPRLRSIVLLSDNYGPFRGRWQPFKVRKRRHSLFHFFRGRIDVHPYRFGMSVDHRDPVAYRTDGDVGVDDLLSIEGAQNLRCFSLHLLFLTTDVGDDIISVSYTHLRAHETRHDLVCRLLLEKKKKKK